MAINILTEPADPPGSGDYTRDQAIQHSNETPMLSILSDWELTAAAPLAKQGAFIRHAGNTFQVQTADEAISGSPAAGLNYIIATEAAGVITLAWATATTGYTFNPAYGGMYNVGGSQLLRDVCYLSGTAYNRGSSKGESHNYIILSNGEIITLAGLTQLKGVTVADIFSGSGTSGLIYSHYSPFLSADRPKIKCTGGIWKGSGYPMITLSYIEYFSSSSIRIHGMTTAGVETYETIVSGTSTTYRYSVAI